MSYPNHPIEIYIHGPEGFREFVESYATENDAVKAIPALIADCQSHIEEYAGHYFQIVRHEVDGLQEWHEPIEKFNIIP
jgi:hypothetical protein